MKQTLVMRRHHEKPYEETPRHVSIYGYLDGGLFPSGPEPRQSGAEPSKDKNREGHAGG